MATADLGDHVPCGGTAQATAGPESARPTVLGPQASPHELPTNTLPSPCRPSAHSRPHRNPQPALTQLHRGRHDRGGRLRSLPRRIHAQLRSCARPATASAAEASCPGRPHASPSPPRPSKVTPPPREGTQALTQPAPWGSGARLQGEEAGLGVPLGHPCPRRRAEHTCCPAPACCQRPGWACPELGENRTAPCSQVPGGQASAENTGNLPRFYVLFRFVFVCCLWNCHLTKVSCAKLPGTGVCVGGAGTLGVISFVN